ncbi:MAG TPA: sigma-70 family RNA polymerase sigma factor [Solirubrobacteraceae bacterium]|nr:sigma-70 family RNA polymerase sigma factor [Solirubrobacteraceae bacterium]
MERRIRFELLYAKHGPAVKAYILRRAPASLADDLVAEVFVVCWRRFDELPVDPLPWLLGVARRVLATQRRGERRSVALHDRIAENSTPPVQAHASTVGEEMLAALQRLSASDRELLALIAWEGLSPVQAAGVLGIRPATARVRLHRARRRLGVALAREQDRPSACSSLSMEASP